jgi:uroporphyrinogen-III decarboxylase
MGVGDPAASLVSPGIFAEFVFPAQEKLVDGLKAMGLRTRSHICGNTLRIMNAGHSTLRQMRLLLREEDEQAEDVLL